MLLLHPTTITTFTTTSSSSPLSLSKFPTRTNLPTIHSSLSSPQKMSSWLGKLGFGARLPTESPTDPSSSSSSIAQSPDDDSPAAGQAFAQFGAGCFWGAELAFQRIPGVTKSEVGYSQGYVDKPTYNDVCSGTTGHSEVVRVQYDPKECSYEALLDAFWARHDPTTLNRQVGFVGFLWFLLLDSVAFVDEFWF